MSLNFDYHRRCSRSSSIDTLSLENALSVLCSTPLQKRKLRALQELVGRRLPYCALKSTQVTRYDVMTYYTQKDQLTWLANVMLMRPYVGGVS
jgi:hypothetical protein